MSISHHSISFAFSVPNTHIHNCCVLFYTQMSRRIHTQLEYKNAVHSDFIYTSARTRIHRTQYTLQYQNLALCSDTTLIFIWMRSLWYTACFEPRCWCYLNETILVWTWTWTHLEHMIRNNTIFMSHQPN